MLSNRDGLLYDDNKWIFMMKNKIKSEHEKLFLKIL